MAVEKSYEQTHQSYVTDLIEKYGKLFSSENINEFYGEQRKALEENATVLDYIPLLTFKAVKEVLENLSKNNKDNLDKKIKVVLSLESVK